METITLSNLEQAQSLVHSFFPGTPQYRWPLLCERLGCEVWVKHENYTPVGAFKIRGGLVFVKDRADKSEVGGMITATRGNHGQSIATAASRYSIPVTIVVPKGNSVEKNNAMRAQGGKLIEFGDDFQAASDHAAELAGREDLYRLPSFHPLLVRGVGTYALELLQAQPDLDTIYVPIGMGSGACGVIAARDALGLKTKVVGVVCDKAPAYALSFEAGRPVETETADTWADGVACRSPMAEAVEMIHRGADRVVTVSEALIAEAMRVYFTDTHNLAEGAGAIALAALMQEKEKMKNKKSAVILTGGNLDLELYSRVLKGEI
ncbi:threonine dehydratase [Aestuariispira insulae]|uniref:Threonine dehydratase n=1 Tax=Aestuariispira insulae TaxID=1461337 RepID=A0A3D9HJY3_9PROT|nr:threonine dehydratase [Aestuariispira insulae]RED49800.1 threonine dehydratase [Aestuariispira insulae]